MGILNYAMMNLISQLLKNSQFHEIVKIPDGQEVGRCWSEALGKNSNVEEKCDYN